MIIWLTGNSGSGKTSLAIELQKNMVHSIILDGNSLRDVWRDLGLGRKDRYENNYRVARLANVLHQQNYNVIVAVIAPYKELRTIITSMLIPDIKWVYVCRSADVVSISAKPYEVPYNPDITVYPEIETIKIEASRIIGILGRSE